MDTKIYRNAHEAIKDITNGSTIAVGGFGVCGTPEELLHSVCKKGCKNLTIVSNNIGIKDSALDKLLHSGQIKRSVCSYPGKNTNYPIIFLSGKVEIELVPQGTLIEKIRCGGAGIPAFYVPTGCETMVEYGGIPIKYNKDGKTMNIVSEPKETKTINGKKYLLEYSITTDFSLIKAWKSDKKGNLVFRSTAQNFNPDCAKAGKICIAEVEEIVENGELKPEEIHLPGIYVDRIVKSEEKENLILSLKTTHDSEANKLILIDRLKSQMNNVSRHLKDKNTIMMSNKIKDSLDVKLKNYYNNKVISKRVIKEFKNGMHINLGIGIPNSILNYIPRELNIMLHSENGLLGIGSYPEMNMVNADITNAGGETVTHIDGSSTFSSSESFAMIRGGHIDITVIGALQVDRRGSVANWIIPGKSMNGMGGAMDLVSSTNKVIVAMKHSTKDGNHKILENCDFPLTGKNVVSMIVTELAVFTIDPDGLTLIEYNKESSVSEIREKTGTNFKISPNLCFMS